MTDNLPICCLCRRNEYGGICPPKCLKHPRINFGSGLFPKGPFVNFDSILCQGDSPPYLQTDIVGSIEDIPTMLPLNFFAVSMSVHLIEHLYYEVALDFLYHQFAILRPGGKIIVEGPSVVGIFQWYLEGKYTLREMLDMYYPQRTMEWGQSLPAEFAEFNSQRHRSGWTGEVVAEELLKMGFKILTVGSGLLHKCPGRDFRVEAYKP